MATGTLTGQTIANTYKSLLKITGTTAGGETLHATTLKVIEDGDGNPSPIQLSQNRIEIVPTANHANAFEVSQADGTQIFNINSTTPGLSLVGTLTVGADDAGHDVIFYGDTASSNMTWDTSADDLVLNDSRLFINQDDNSTSIDIDSEATTEPVIQVDTPASTTHPIINLTNLDSLTTGGGLRIASNSSDNTARNLLFVENDHTSATGAKCATFKQDASAIAVFIDQGADDHGIDIDTEATTKAALRIIDPKITTGTVVEINDCDDLTSGTILYIASNSSNTGSRKLVNIVNDHASATGTTVFNVVQDAACEAVVIDQNANSIALSIDAENTTQPAVNIVCDALTSGEALRVYSNTGDSSNRNLVEIINDHADADNTRTMYIQNDGALYGIEMAGGCGIRFDNTVSSTDDDTLDDYEEGTWTPTIFNATSGGTQVGAATSVGRYVKIGQQVHLQGYFVANALNVSGSNFIYIRGLPFVSHSTSNLYSAGVVGFANGLAITAGHHMALNVDHNGGSHIQMNVWDATGGTTQMTGDELSADGQFIFQVSYATN